MVERLLIVMSLLIAFRLVYKWTRAKTGDAAYEDYSQPKPPLYVYYNTSGFQMSMYLYFSFALLIAFLFASMLNRFLDNTIAAIILFFIILYGAKQLIVIRSVRFSSTIDNDAPGFLTFFGSLLIQINDPIFALGMSVKYANRSYRHVIDTLYVRLRNGQDPYLEIDRAKRQFRNRVMRNFLDDLGDHLHKGNILNTTIDRLIERAQDRLRYAAERKIETYTGISIIYGGLILEFVAIGLISIIRPEILDVFIISPIGRFAVWVMVSISGMMLLISQRLILLSEG